MARFDAHGAPLGALSISAIDAQMGYPTISILRRELQRILLARAAMLAIPLSYGCLGREVGDAGRVAWATFDGGERVEADLVIGADGRMASSARRYVAPTHEAVFQGFVNWVGTAEASAPIVERMNEIRDYWGVGRRFGIVPIDASRVYWAAGEAAASDDAGDPMPLREQVHTKFAGWPELITTVVEASAPTSVRRIAVYDLEPLSRWHRGRVVLIGDAAHASLPTSGQGACQALEDAWHLARLLPVAPDAAPLDAALCELTARREDKARQITLAGRHLARSLFDRDPDACRRRDEAARVASGMEHRMAVLWSRGLPVGVTGP
jgi:2-polyprenyl-6-methoxyphenol hydroxylase-like FAD-dependent oxidoreductase